MNSLTRLLACLALATVVLAQQAPRRGQSYQVSSIDLDGDGRKEKVGLVCSEVKESGWFSRLTVWDSSGSRKWQSMPAKVGVWSFGCWDWGQSDLPWVGDLDGDGKVEALSPEPVSDVRPVSFRVFRWNGKAFQHVQTAALVGIGERDFEWSEQARGERWIGNFRPGGIGVVWDMKAGGEPREGQIVPTPRGFRIQAWKRP